MRLWVFPAFQRPSIVVPRASTGLGSRPPRFQRDTDYQGVAIVRLLQRSLHGMVASMAALALVDADNRICRRNVTHLKRGIWPTLWQ